jgi:hypothetical protein
MTTKQVSQLIRTDRIVSYGRVMYITAIDRDWQAGVAHLVLGWDRRGDDSRQTLHMDETVTVVPEGTQ